MIYGQVGQAVYRMGTVGADSKRRLDLNYLKDYAPGNVTQYDHQIWADARWIGPAGGRWSNDTVVIVYIRTAFGSRFREETLATGGSQLSAEHLVEINYLANATPWLSVQPAMHFVAKPAGDAI